MGLYGLLGVMGGLGKPYRNLKLASKGKLYLGCIFYEAQAGMMEMVLDVEKLTQAVEKVRRDASQR